MKIPSTPPKFQLIQSITSSTSFSKYLIRILTKDTLDDLSAAGFLRTTDDIYIYINTCWQLPLAAIAEGVRQHSRITSPSKTMRVL